MPLGRRAYLACQRPVKRRASGGGVTRPSGTCTRHGRGGASSSKKAAACFGESQPSCREPVVTVALVDDACRERGRKRRSDVGWAAGGGRRAAGGGGGAGRFFASASKKKEKEEKSGAKSGRTAADQRQTSGRTHAPAESTADTGRIPADLRQKNGRTLAEWGHFDPFLPQFCRDSAAILPRASWVCRCSVVRLPLFHPCHLILLGFCRLSAASRAYSTPFRRVLPLFHPILPRTQ